MFDFKFSSIQAEVVGNIKSGFAKVNPYKKFEQLTLKLYGGKLMAAILKRMDKLVVDMNMTDEQVAVAKAFVKDLESIVSLNADDKATVKSNVSLFKLENAEVIDFIMKKMPKLMIAIEVGKLENIVDILNASVKTEDVD